MEQQSSELLWNRLNVLALTDSTGYGKLVNMKTQKTEFVHDCQQGIFHIISPGAALSAAGNKNQLALAHALKMALQDNAVLKDVLSENLKTKVIFIKAKDSCKAKPTQYKRMEDYREAMDLKETDFTIMSLESQVFANRVLELI